MPEPWVTPSRLSPSGFPDHSTRQLCRRAVGPGGPAAIALKTGAPLMPAYQYATSPGHHHVHLDRPLAIGAGETKAALMQRVVDRLEGFIKERPEQWYAFRPMFKRE